MSAPRSPTVAEIEAATGATLTGAATIGAASARTAPLTPDAVDGVMRAVHDHALDWHAAGHTVWVGLTRDDDAHRLFVAAEVLDPLLLLDVFAVGTHNRGPRTAAAARRVIARLREAVDLTPTFADPAGFRARLVTSPTLDLARQTQADVLGGDPFGDPPVAPLDPDAGFAFESWGVNVEAGAASIADNLVSRRALALWWG